MTRHLKTNGMGAFSFGTCVGVVANNQYPTVLSASEQALSNFEQLKQEKTSLLYGVEARELLLISLHELQATTSFSLLHASLRWSPSNVCYIQRGFQRIPLTLHKEILQSKSEMINQLLEIEHGKIAHAGTRKGLDDSGYDSISDEEKDARPRFPFTHAATKAKRGGYNNLEKERKEVCEWSAILGEANELAGLHGKACNSFNPSFLPEGRRYHKGGRGNSRFKFSFRSLSNKEDFSGDHSLSRDETYSSCEEDIEGPAKWDYFEHGTEEDTVPQLMENILEESVEPANKPEFHKQLAGAASVCELLEDLQKTDPSSRRTLAVDNSKGKARRRSSSKRTLLCLGNRVLDNKDAPEFMGDISSEDEHIDQDYQAFQIVKGQTMADLFQEAFNTSIEEIAGIPRSNIFGLHGRLQHVIKLGENRHTEFLKELQTRTPSNESNHIIVRILSRTFEAKLTVCQCFFGENSNSFQCEKGFDEGFENRGSRTKTIIFSPAFCSNVELEVGSIVCIHQPWKEFQIKEGESIILSAYFSSCL